MSEPDRVDLVHGEEGMLSLASLFAVLGLLLLIALMVNVGRTTNRKLEMQNAADAVAHAASVEMARGLNSITAANHLAGELTALVILHHGFGGDELDSGDEPPRTPWVERLTVPASYYLALFASSLGQITKPLERAYDKVKEDPEVGGAIWDSQVRLKRVLTWAYMAHAIGAFLAAVLEKIPEIGPALNLVIHGAIIWPAGAFQWKVYQEWVLLEWMVTVVRSVGKLTKKPLQEFLVPGMQVYSYAVAGMAPSLMQKASEEVAKPNAATGSLYPRFNTLGIDLPSLPFVGNPILRLPVTRDQESPERWEHSQLVRATTPWVQRWRVPVLQFGEDALLLSRFKCHYWDRTDEYTQTITERLRTTGRVKMRLLVLPGWTPDGTPKGQETWTRSADDGSREADRLFCVLGFAYRPAQKRTGYAIFREANPDGNVTYAQAMAYNANPQTPNDSGEDQPRVGWDTLNWANTVAEFPGQRPTNNTYPVPSVDEPRIRLNWQAKLVPTTRLVEARNWVGGDVGKILERTPRIHLSLTGTH